MERLSTGLRINSAKDDAAGLAIVKKMNAQVSGLKMAAKNANDGISMLQTFEGATKEVTNILTRMRELVVQSSNETYTNADKANMGVEYDQLRAEIDRILTNTEWNTMSLLDESGGKTVNLQIGANSNQTMAVNIANWKAGATSRTHVVTTSTPGNGTNNEKQNVAFKTTTNGTPTAGTDSVLGKGETFTLSYTEGNNTFSYSYTNTSSTTMDSEDLADQIIADYTADPTTFLGGGWRVTPVKTTAGSIIFQRTANDFADVNLMTSTVSSGSAKPSAWASKSLADIDNAISFATTERANYGAYINRLNYAADNLASVSLSTDASRGRIEDADYAAETTELARTQIIAQAGTAMLAQANQVKQSVLALLK
jgi:flagellin